MGLQRLSQVFGSGFREFEKKPVVSNYWLQKLFTIVPGFTSPKSDLKGDKKKSRALTFLHKTNPGDSNFTKTCTAPKFWDMIQKLFFFWVFENFYIFVIKSLLFPVSLQKSFFRFARNIFSF